MSAEENAALAKTEDFAARVLSSITPLKVGVAGSKHEIEAVFRLRYEVVVHRQWGRPEDFPERLERDSFDDRALQIGVWKDGELVGTTRLVTPQEGKRVPVEETFGIELGHRDRLIDMGRTCRKPGIRDAGQKIIWGLLAQSWIEARALGFTEICGCFSSAMIRFYRRFGLRIEILGQARQHWGELRFPVLVRPAEFVDLLRQPGTVIRGRFNSGTDPNF
jgi:N-acyl-L-homoserine lactone synthetase